jgi:hypothetical protein
MYDVMKYVYVYLIIYVFNYLIIYICLISLILYIYI